jgi:hypothetical protein
MRKIMEAATAIQSRRADLVHDVATPETTPDSSRMLPVSATYLLSEEGRKTSLLAGGDGRAIQELTIQVPANRLHLVSVDADGVARLKLRPRYHLDGEHGISRIDAPPSYDAPPDVEDLFREAARNHQLEGTFHAERRAARTRRRDTDRERRAQVAQAFLADRAQRALVHPAPTPKRCYITCEFGRMLFDADADELPARQVPVEAHKRFRTDLRERKERNQQERATQLAVHEEKKRFIAEWIAAHGTPEQRARNAAGMLPIEEAIEVITDHALAAAGDRPPYSRDGAPRLQAYLRQFPKYATTVVTSLDLAVTSSNAPGATAAQWSLVQELQAALPDSTIALREHTLQLKRDREAPALRLFGILVTCKRQVLTLRREFAAPDCQI